MKIQTYTDPELIAAIQNKSVRKPEWDADGIEVWVAKDKTAHYYFKNGAYLYSDPMIPPNDMA